METRVCHCRVCAVLDDDRSEKECSYYSFADVWVCEADRASRARLAAAGVDSGLRPCDVCVLLDNDETPKECKWCGLCKAWICERCRPNLLRRSQAAGMKLRLLAAGGQINA